MMAGIRIASVLFAALATLALLKHPAVAEEGAKDPKEWCGRFTALVGSGTEDEITQMLHAGSLGNINPAGALVALAPMIALVKSDDVKSISFLTQKSYEDAYIRIWYMMVVGHKGTFYRCTFIKYDDIWQLTDFDFNTSSDELLLP